MAVLEQYLAVGVHAPRLASSDEHGLLSLCGPTRPFYDIDDVALAEAEEAAVRFGLLP